jgi:hypothetical protein
MEPHLPDYQVELLALLYEADKLDSSTLHDFKELMPDASRPDLEVAYEDFQHYGFLHRASGQTFGGPFGRLSTVGRRFVESLGIGPTSVTEQAAHAAPDDQYFRFAGGTVIVRDESTEEPWLLTWLPDQSDDPSYPGFTVSPDLLEFPTAHGVGGILEWAAKQPWARRAAGEEIETDAPPDAHVIAVPPDEAATFSQHVHMEHGFHVAYTPEPDGSFSWAVLTEDGFRLQSGVSNTWDDMRLEAVENLQPPSDEVD